MLKAVLLDVGGTLWPDGAPRSVTMDDGAQVSPDEYSTRELRLVLGDLTEAQCSALAVELRHTAETTIRRAPEIDPRGAIRDVTARLGYPNVTSDTVDAIRRAMIVPFVRAMPFFPGVPELFDTIRLLDLRCVLVSNTVWRDADAYRDELVSCPFADVINGIVTSVDARVNKPHPRMFTSALDMIRVAPEEAVMVGNSETNDIVPARSMGMRTMRVCIEERLDPMSTADAVVTSIDELSAYLETWKQWP